jgi:CBS domain-containing protein
MLMKLKDFLAYPQTIDPSVPLKEAAKMLFDSGWEHFVVVDKEQRLQGVVTKIDLLRGVTGDLSCVGETMTPLTNLISVEINDELQKVVELFEKFNINQIPVVEDPENKFKGVIYRAHLRFKNAKTPETEFNILTPSLLLNSSRESIIAVDRDLHIREINDAACSLLECTRGDVLGRELRLVSRDLLLDVFKNEENIKEIYLDYKGENLFCRLVPIWTGKEIRGVLLTFSNVTELHRTKDDLEKAFRLTLPNSKTEYKLKNTPEYTDEYDPTSGKIKITGVIPSGGYLHLINALRVTADFYDQRVFDLIGLDKDLMVKTLVFHDLGKRQPQLKVGEVVEPREVFEPGKLHAYRSAEWAKKFYHQPDDAVTLVRYHHHKEDELPQDFPEALLPMYRLLRLIDGLSAVVTRRKGRWEAKFQGTLLYIKEESSHPNYGGEYIFDPYALLGLKE